MEDEETSLVSVDIPIFEPKPKKRGRKKKDNAIIISEVGPKDEVEMFMDSIISSVSRMTLSYEAEIKSLRTFLTAAALKLGGKMNISKEILDLASEQCNELKIFDENGFTKITL